MKTIFTLLLCLFSFGVSFAQHQKFAWLQGSWKLANKDVFEEWKLNESGQNLSGRSFRIKGSDTTVTEVISLEFYAGSFHYIPDVAGDQPPVDFKITFFDNHGFVAENPQHDFPKIIRYRHLTGDGDEKIEATISGNGERISYLFEKVK